jgi:hypothetical protein
MKTTVERAVDADHDGHVPRAKSARNPPRRRKSAHHSSRQPPRQGPPASWQGKLQNQSGNWHRKRLRPWRKPDPGPPGASSRCTDIHVQDYKCSRKEIQQYMPGPPFLAPSCPRGGVDVLL